MRCRPKCMPSSKRATAMRSNAAHICARITLKSTIKKHRLPMRVCAKPCRWRLIATLLPKKCSAAAKKPPITSPAPAPQALCLMSPNGASSLIPSAWRRPKSSWLKPAMAKANRSRSPFYTIPLSSTKKSPWPLPRCGSRRWVL